MTIENPFIAIRDSGYDITGQYESVFNDLSQIYLSFGPDWWKECEAVANKVSETEKYNLLFIAIESLLDDNLISPDEHDFIIKLEKALQINVKAFKKSKKKDIERILAIQLHLFYLDGVIDPGEAEEISGLQEIFGYSQEEIDEVRRRMR